MYNDDRRCRRVAEEVWNKTDPYEVTGPDFWWDPAIMSPKDWNMAYCEPGEPDRAMLRAVCKSYELLNGKLKADLYSTARLLIAGSKSAVSRAHALQV